MGLPLPKVVADVGPGGPLVTSNLGRNALTASNLENTINQVKAQYAPMTTQADAASKLAYANLMGPQFLAKLMANPDILANLPNQQGALNNVVGAATRQGNNPFNMNQSPNPMAGQNPMIQLLAKGINGLRGIVGGNNQSSDQPTQNSFNTPNAYPGNPQPGQSYAYQGNQPQSPGASNNGFMQAPASAPSNASPMQPDSPGNSTFVENAGDYSKTKEQMKKLGELNATDIKEMNDLAFNANTMQSTLNGLAGIVDSPEFREIRQIPIANQKEIGWYSKFGTPAQKRMIGQFLDEQGQVVVNAAGNFKGAFRAGEQALINNMKVNNNDMPEVASGKVMAMSMLNQMLSQRTSRTAQLMEEQHLSKGKAMAIADKEIDGDKIRKNLENNIKVNIHNPKTGERKTVSLSEAREMGVPNV